jgi:hypothetical protein
MDEWYEREMFGGHIRGPDVGHLRYIARDLGLAMCGFSAQLVGVRLAPRLG